MHLKIGAELTQSILLSKIHHTLIRSNVKNIRTVFSVFLFFYLINFSFALTGAKYLIIAADDYVSAIQPLADWKTKKGVKAMVVPLSVTGSSASQIKNYITNAYNTWDITTIDSHSPTHAWTDSPSGDYHD